MKKNYLNTVLLIACCIAVFSACKKDYITGGETEDINKYSQTPSFSVLSQNPLYDTLVQVIEAAGLKDRINSANSTFFIPTDYAIYRYLSQRTLVVQSTINQNSKFGLDSLLYYVKNNVKNTRDSLLMYLIEKPLYYPDFTQVGASYKTALGNNAVISFEETYDGNLGYTNLVSGIPRLVYFTHLWYPYTVSPSTPADEISDRIGVRTRVITSGIITQNGYMNTLANDHTLFFYGTKY